MPHIVQCAVHPVLCLIVTMFFEAARNMAAVSDTQRIQANLYVFTTVALDCKPHVSVEVPHR